MIFEFDIESSCPPPPPYTHTPAHIHKSKNNLLPFHSPMGMADNPFGGTQTQSEEKGGPVHGMETQDVLSHNVSRCGPAMTSTGEARNRQIVDEGIQPDINLEVDSLKVTFPVTVALKLYYTLIHLRLINVFKI